MNRNAWNGIFVVSIGFNCVLALVLFTYEVLDMWGWNPAWILLMTVLVLGCGLVLIWGWLLEHRVAEGDRAILRFTLTQNGVPLSRLVFTLEPVDGLQISDGQGGSTDGQDHLEWMETSEEHSDPFCDPATDRVTHPLKNAVPIRFRGNGGASLITARQWLQQAWESVHDRARNGSFWKTGREE